MLNKKNLAEEGFSYITALTKPQIQTLLAKGTLRMDLLDMAIREVEGDGRRYVLRRNPARVKELAASRRSKQARIHEWIEKETRYLSEHPKARPATALKRLQARIGKRKVGGWLSVEAW